MRRIVRMISICIVPIATLLIIAHEIAWRMPVDSYTYVEQTTSGQILHRQVSLNSANASDVRQLINSQPIEPLFSHCERTPNDSQPQNLRYVYSFQVHGIVIETVSGRSDDCASMEIQALFSVPVWVYGEAPNLPSDYLG